MRLRQFSEPPRTTPIERARVLGSGYALPAPREKKRREWTRTGYWNLRDENGRWVDPVGDGDEQGALAEGGSAPQTPQDDLNAHLDELRERLRREHEEALRRMEMVREQGLLPTHGSPEDTQPEQGAPPAYERAGPLPFEPRTGLDRDHTLRFRRPDFEVPPSPVPTPAPARRARPRLPALSRPRPSLRPRIDGRLAIAGAAVILAGMAGLFAGRATSDDEQASTEPAAIAVADPAAEFNGTLNDELRALSAAREPELRALRAARTPGEQAAASRELAGTHDRVARAIAGAAAPGRLQAQRQSLVAALRKVADAYRRLAAGAASGAPARYEAGLAGIERSEAGLQGRLTAIEASRQ